MFSVHKILQRQRGSCAGAADYIAIAQAVDTVTSLNLFLTWHGQVVLTNIPMLRTDHAHCHRFIVLIDVLYEVSRVVGRTEEGSRLGAYARNFLGRCGSG